MTVRREPKQRKSVILALIWLRKRNFVNNSGQSVEQIMYRTSFSALTFYFTAFVVTLTFSMAGEANAKEDILVGKRLFSAYCSLCHDEDGKGDGALAHKLNLDNVADLTKDKYQRMSVKELLEIIKGYNRDDSDMPQWEAAIPERGLKGIAAYILTLTQTDVRILGDARRGREIFRQSCVACHGPRGEGNGILAKILDVKLINFKSKALSKVSDDDLINVITLGRGKLMPPWSGTLSSEEIEDAAAFVRSLRNKK